MLDMAVRLWFAIAVLGQWIFVAYIVVFHGRVALTGDATMVNKTLPNGYSPGDIYGNFALVVHLAFAAVITLSGALQILPQVRARFPIFHHWNGRLYMFTAILMALSGFWLTLSGRKVIGDASQHIAINLNGVLILVCALFAWRTAIARDFGAHRRWALRLFLVVSGVWFFRVGLMFWLMLHRKPVGFDAQTFTGPFLTILAFAQYLLPLAMLELYLWAQRQKTAWPRLATATALFACSLVTAGGTIAATMGMWLPRMTR